MFQFYDVYKAFEKNPTAMSLIFGGATLGLILLGFISHRYENK